VTFVNLKAMFLIVLVCLASATTTLVLGISVKTMQSAGFVNAEFQGNTRLCNGTVEPTGEIDCPGGPT
jgi:hypothetical protein